MFGGWCYWRIGPTVVLLPYLFAFLFCCYYYYIFFFFFKWQILFILCLSSLQLFFPCAPFERALLACMSECVCVFGQNRHRCATFQIEWLNVQQNCHQYPLQCCIALTWRHTSVATLCVLAIYCTHTYINTIVYKLLFSCYLTDCSHRFRWCWLSYCCCFLLNYPWQKCELLGPRTSRDQQ